MKTFSELERLCHMSFSRCCDLYHAYTSGKEMPILFKTTEDLAFVMNVIALAAYTFKDTVTIIAFEVMNNHFHFIISGSQKDLDEFFRLIVKKIKHTIPSAARLTFCLKPIQDLVALRNNIVYVNRNGYVANPDFTPFSYPWGTGRYYHNEIPSPLTFSDIGYNQNRKMFRGGNVKLPPEWQLDSTGTLAGNTSKSSSIYVAPSSFCDIRLGMSMFRNAHHYFSMVSKNVESYSNLAVDIDDGEFLTDQELFLEVIKILHSKYNGVKLNSLSNAQRYDLARTLHFEYRSSNGQIRRVLGLGEYEVNQLFPVNQ